MITLDQQTKNSDTHSHNNQMKSTTAKAMYVTKANYHDEQR